MPGWKSCVHGVGGKLPSYARAERGWARFATRCSSKKFQSKSNRKLIVRPNIRRMRGSRLCSLSWSIRTRATKSWEFSEKSSESPTTSWHDLLKATATNSKLHAKPEDAKLSRTH